MNLITEAKIIFWDFDGVIKDSVDVKTKAFTELFKNFGAEVITKVANHHTNNGGMSRFDKIPIYLDWAGLTKNQENVDLYCNKFASIVEDKVVNSSWVPGVLGILANKTGVPNVLVTATPHDEILRIVDRLSITHYFSAIFGAPMTKASSIKKSLEKYDITAVNAVMIGDARADYLAAKENGVNFLLRRTPENQISMPDYLGPTIHNFLENA